MLAIHPNSTRHPVYAFALTRSRFLTCLRRVLRPAATPTNQKDRL